MPQEIARLAAELLRSPVRVEVSPPTRTAERIDQRVFMVEAGAKRAFLANLLADPSMARVIVFTRTKHGADRVADHLGRAGIAADAIHGNKSQGQRERALERFRAGNARVLVATDIAARGIDVTDITHVVNYEIPNIAESYVHRIGRTARAGATGIAISLCDPSERGFMRDIEKLTAVRLIDDGADPVQTAAPANRRGGKPAPAARRNRRWSRPQHQRRRAA
jgi:ATP-dependent RNA helicase RhlE